MNTTKSILISMAIGEVKLINGISIHRWSKHIYLINGKYYGLSAALSLIGPN